MEYTNQFAIFPPGGVSPPKGLNAVMEGLVREVLLKNPKDILAFSAEYFEKLIDIRFNTSAEESKEISNLVYLHQNNNDLYKNETNKILLPTVNNNECISIEPVDNNEKQEEVLNMNMVETSEEVVANRSIDIQDHDRNADNLLYKNEEYTNIETDKNHNIETEVTNDKPESVETNEVENSHDLKHEEEFKESLELNQNLPEIGTNENEAVLINENKIVEIVNSEENKINEILSNDNDSDDVNDKKLFENNEENIKHDSPVDGEKISSTNKSNDNEECSDVTEISDVNNIHKINENMIINHESINDESIANSGENLEQSNNDAEENVNEKETSPTTMNDVEITNKNEEADNPNNENLDFNDNNNIIIMNNLESSEVILSTKSETAKDIILNAEEIQEPNQNDVQNVDINKDSFSTTQNEDVVVNSTEKFENIEIVNVNENKIVSDENLVVSSNSGNNTLDLNEESETHILDNKSNQDLCNIQNENESGEILHQNKTEMEQEEQNDLKKTEITQELNIPSNNDDSTVIDNSNNEEISIELDHADLHKESKNQESDNFNTSVEVEPIDTGKSMENNENDCNENNFEMEINISEKKNSTTENTPENVIQNDLNVRLEKNMSNSSETNDLNTNDPTIIENRSIVTNSTQRDMIEKACIVIQKIFRGFLVRSKIRDILKNKKNILYHQRAANESLNKSNDSDDVGNVIYANVEPMLYTVPEERNSSYSTEDESSTFSSAATKIQAGVRGYLTRKYYQLNKTYNSSDTTAPSIGEDGKSFDEIINTLDSQNNDDTVSKIIVATSSILIEQLEHFEKLENRSIQNSTLSTNSLDLSKESDPNKLRKRLKREDAIQLHSPYSSGETQTNKHSSGKASDDDEPIGDLAQSIITEIISNTHLSPNHDQNIKEFDNTSSTHQENKNTHEAKSEITKSEEINTNEILHDISEENVEKRANFSIKLHESMQSDDGDVIIGSIKTMRPLSQTRQEHVEDNLTASNEEVENIFAAKNEEVHNDLNLFSDHTNIIDNDVKKYLDIIQTADNQSDNSSLTDVINEKVNEENEFSELIHSGEFHDAVLPTKIIRQPLTPTKEFFI